MNNKPHLPPYDVKQVVFTRLLQELSNWAFRSLRIKQLWEHSKGKGVRVAVLDTGSTHKDIEVRKFVNFSDDVDEDRNGHGCLTGKTEIYIEGIGLTTLERMWNQAHGKNFVDKHGRVKEVPKGLRTLCLNSFTNVKYLYRTKSDKKVVIQTSLGEIEATPWHKFFVAKFLKYKNHRNPFGNPDSHPHKKNGYKIIEVEAKNLKSGDILVGSKFKRDPIIRNSPIDIAYLAGEIEGDGTIIDRKGHHEIRIHDKSKKQLEKISIIIKRLGPSPYIRKASNTDGYELGFTSKKLVETFSKFAFKDTFDDFEKMCAWLAGFFDAEGHYDKERDRIRLSNFDYHLLHSIRKTLKVLGLKSSIYRVFSKEHMVKGHLIKDSESFQLHIPNGDLFYNLIKFYSLAEKIPPENIKNHYQADLISIDFRGLARIKDIEIRETDEYFYDLCTGAQNYLAGGLAVHNTWVSGCVRATGGFLGIAPQSELYIAKILNNDGSGDWNWMKKGLQWALEEEVHIVNISAGGDYTGNDIQPVLKELYDKGVVVVCAAGNASNFLIFPAEDKHTLAVGAVDKKLEKARFSNFGPRLLVMAPGVELLGCWTDNGYAKLSGTSMAAPIISSILALERGIRSINLRDVIAKIAWTSKDMQAFGWDMNTGWGLIEPKKFMLIEPTDKKITWAWIINLLAFLIAYFVGDEENKVTTKRALFGRR